MHEIADPNTHLSNKKGILGKQMFCCLCPALMRPTQPWFRLEFSTAIRTKLPSPCLERSAEQFICNRGPCFLVPFSEAGRKQHSHRPFSRYQLVATKHFITHLSHVAWNTFHQEASKYDQQTVLKQAAQF